MNLDALERLSTEGLQTLKTHVEGILARRLDTRIMVGRTGHFVSRDGSRRQVIVDKVNRTTVTVTEANTGKQWCVSTLMMVMDPIERKVPVPAPLKKAPPKTSPTVNREEVW